MLERMCEACGYVAGEGDGRWCQWCDAPILTRDSGCLFVSGWAFLVLGCLLFWLGVWRLLT